MTDIMEERSVPDAMSILLDDMTKTLTDLKQLDKANAQLRNQLKAGMHEDHRLLFDAMQDLIEQWSTKNGRLLSALTELQKNLVYVESRTVAERIHHNRTRKVIDTALKVGS
jgi:hypothetical protein